jgi:hypothetical protein
MTENERSILNRLREGHPAEAVDAMLAERPRIAIETCRMLIVHLVTEQKDPVSAILLGWAGATHAHRVAREAPAVHGLDREFAEHARSLFFTLGSLLWPGWGDPDLVLDSTAMATGLGCARRAASLAEELEASSIVRSRSHWLVGVHALFAGRLELSRDELLTAARLARGASAPAEIKLLRSYLLMTQAAMQPEDPEIPREFHEACREFESEPGSAPFARQLRVAWSMWAPDRPLPGPVDRPPLSAAR